MIRPEVIVDVQLARRAKVGVILQRNPSGARRLIRWDTGSDDLTAGPWLDQPPADLWDLSPEGSRVLFTQPGFRAPTVRFTVLASVLDAEILARWNTNGRPGGGRFEKDGGVVLNGVPGQTPKESPPQETRYTHQLFAENYRAWQNQRQQRDGWTLRMAPAAPGCPPYLTVLEKRRPSKKAATLGKLYLNGASSSIHYLLWRPDCPDRARLENASWADWDHRGRLVFTRDGLLISATPRR